MEVAQVVGHPTGNHTRNHHAQGLHGGADAEDGGTALALREIDEVEHVGGEAEAVAELFDEDAEVDDEQGGRIRGCSQGGGATSCMYRALGKSSWPVNGQGRSHLSTYLQETFWDLKVKKLQISLAESGKVATFAAYKNKKRMQYPTKRFYLLINVAFFNGSLLRIAK